MENTSLTGRQIGTLILLAVAEAKDGIPSGHIYEQFDNPSAFRDVGAVIARQQLALIRRYENEGLSEMEAGAKAALEIPEFND